MKHVLHSPGLTKRRHRERHLRLHTCEEIVYSLLLFLFVQTRIEMNPQTDKIVRRTTMVATVVASYFLLTGDYGPEPNVLDPIRRKILSAQDSLKQFVFGSKAEPSVKEQSDNAK